MYIILTYDVGKKRVSMVMKTCRKYLLHVQNSVFEGTVTEAKLKRLKNELAHIIQIEHDSVQIYELCSLRFVTKSQIGKCKVSSNIIN